MLNKNIKKITITLFSVAISSATFAVSYDATQIQDTSGFVPSANTQAVNAKTDATTALQKATSVESIALEASGIAKGTRATLVNRDGCVYNSLFDCTEDNLTHVYKSKSWTTPGTYYWRVPAGVTTVLVNMRGGTASTWVSDDYDCISYGMRLGGAVEFGTLKAKGDGEIGYYRNDERFYNYRYNYNYPGCNAGMGSRRTPREQSITQKINITPNSNIRVRIHGGNPGYVKIKY